MKTLRERIEELLPKKSTKPGKMNDFRSTIISECASALEKHARIMYGFIDEEDCVEDDAASLVEVDGATNYLKEDDRHSFLILGVRDIEQDVRASLLEEIATYKRNKSKLSSDFIYKVEVYLNSKG